MINGATGTKCDIVTPFYRRGVIGPFSAADADNASSDKSGDDDGAFSRPFRDVTENPQVLGVRAFQLSGKLRIIYWRRFAR